MARLGGSKKKKSPRTTELNRLKRELQRVTAQLQSRDRERIGTSEILRVIANSPADAQSVLDTIAENAAQLCESADAQIYRLESDIVRKVAVYGDLSPGLPVGEARKLSGASPSGRAILDRQVVHVHDMLAQGEEDYSDVLQNVRKLGVRTGLAVPLMCNDAPIGAITVRRTELRPFTENQIALLKTFADQAVIAIENARLFQELKESLEQQMATSEILGVIASSPTDTQPVLDTVAENAARLCEATDAAIMRVNGDKFWLVASHGPNPILRADEGRPITRGSHVGRAIIDRETIHIHDLSSAEAQAEFFETRAAVHAGIRTVLVTPLVRKGIAVGAILIQRKEVCPFSEKQIKLLETFADQAVIAIENVRLFQELQDRNRDLTEALEQQTATGEVLRVIASSPTELQPVLDTLITNAVKLAGATQGHMRQVDGELLRLVAHYNE
jgi:GAF domain-containing protein